MQHTLDFLSRLSRNNDKSWFDANKQEYTHLRDNFNLIVSELIERISAFDESISGLDARNCVYRIYRDLRFSPDKRPYKCYMSAFISPYGKSGEGSGYYLHIEPAEGGFMGRSMIAVGIHCPGSDVLKSIREEIMLSPEGFREALNRAKGFELDYSTALKRVPSGFSAQSAEADFFRLRDFTLYHNLDNGNLIAEGLAERLSSDFSRARDFNLLLNRCYEYARQTR